MNNRTILGRGACALAVVFFLSCTDEGEDDGTTSTGSLATGAGGGATTTTATGAGGDGGSGGGAGCMAESVAAAYFAVEGDALCIVSKHDAPDLDLLPYVGKTPSWGSHGGPLTLEATETMVTIERWSLGLETNDLTASAETRPVSGVGMGAFLGTQMVDLTLGEVFGWSGMDFANEGGLVLVGATSGASHLATGPYGLGASGDVLFYTGLSALDGPANFEPGLYRTRAVDAGGGNLDFEDGELVALWGLATGPVAVDTSGNVFAVMTDYMTGTQELRAFDAPDVAMGMPPTSGVALATMPGFGDALAILPIQNALPGLAIFQPNEASMAAPHLDVVAVPFSSPEGDIGPTGDAAPLLTLAQADTNLTLMTDDEGRLWVGAANAEGGQGSVFFVLDRR